MSEIRVDPQFLINLSSRARRVARDLENYTHHGGCNLNSAPTVARAYAELGKRWDFNRGKLVKGLDALADSFDAAREALLEADRSAANELSGAGGGT